MKITESQLRKIIREEIVAKKKLNEMGPEVAAAFSNVGSSMAGMDLGMIAPAVLVSALAAAGMSKPMIDKVLAKVKMIKDEATGALPPENY
jgi:hypothetical protein